MSQASSSRVPKRELLAAIRNQVPIPEIAHTQFFEGYPPGTFRTTDDILRALSSLSGDDLNELAAELQQHGLLNLRGIQRSMQVKRERKRAERAAESATSGLVKPFVTGVRSLLSKGNMVQLSVARASAPAQRGHVWAVVERAGPELKKVSVTTVREGDPDVLRALPPGSTVELERKVTPSHTVQWTSRRPPHGFPPGTPNDLLISFVLPELPVRFGERAPRGRAALTAPPEFGGEEEEEEEDEDVEM